MSGVQCFLVRKTDLVEVALRRFSFAKDVPEGGCEHESGFKVILERAQATEWLVPLDDGVIESSRNLAPEDERWPLMCPKCGKEFPPDSTRQVWVKPVYEGAPDGVLRSLRNLLPGSMYDSLWETRYDGWHHADGHAWTVVLPDGVHWNIDRVARHGGRWERTGEPPELTVSPSIRTGTYHGHLVGGVLRPC